MNTTCDVLIIGGGITGLAAAYRLQSLLPGRSLVLAEAQPRLGGLIVTDRAGGFVVEGGPDSFLAGKPRGLGLCEELGLADRLEGPDPANRRTFVLSQGRLHPLPEGLSGLVPARLEPLLASDLFSSEGKARLQQESNVPPEDGNADETLGAFVTRRFGREVYENLIEPLMAGIYAGDGDQLSLQATFPQLRELERAHGSLLRGLSAQPPPAGARPGFLTPRGGMQCIVDALAQQIGGVGVLRDSRVDSVEARPAGYRCRFHDGDKLDAEAVIIATPAHVAAGQLASLDADFSTILSAIPYASAATISLGFPIADLPHPLDGYGYVVPRSEDRPILASTWVSRKWRHRAPADSALIRLFVGRYGRDSLVAANDDTLLEAARDELRAVLGISAKPVFQRIFRWPSAMPQYTLGHPERVTALAATENRWPGVALAGIAYRGVGIPDCIRSGEEAAEHVAHHLRATKVGHGAKKTPTA